MIRLLLVDDHAVVREGVKRILADTDDILVTGEAAHAQEAYAALAAATYDAVLLDLSLLEGDNGFDILTHMQKTCPMLPVLIFSVHPERQYVIRALQAGAAGYLLKSSVPQELVRALRQVAQGQRYVSAGLVEHLMSAVAVPAQLWPLSLSPRERQVLHMLATGASMKEIAYDLSLNVKTVSTYRHRLLHKLQLRTTADLIRYALEHPDVSAPVARLPQEPA